MKTAKFDYFIDLDLFNKAPYSNLLKTYNAMFPNTKHCFKINDSVYIYNKGIKILLTQQIRAYNRITEKDENININPILSCYIEGFKEGEIYFDQNYGITPDTMYRNQQVFERELHDLYFHSIINGFEGGWKKYITFFSYVITNSEIYKYGYYAGIVHRLETLKVKYAVLFRNFDKCILPNGQPKAFPHQHAETKMEEQTVELKPILKPEAVQVVFDILKDFFSTEQQTEFKQVIETGNKASNKLIFKGNGNRLTDTFKKLIEHNFILGCQKQDLINWIISNFNFIQQSKVKSFIYDTVEKTISRNFYPCKSPLIEIINGQIHKVEEPRKRQQNKH